MSFIDKLPFWFNKESKEELGATLGAIDRELKLTYQDIIALRKEFDLRTATSMWLDEHGSWYGFPRLPNELDDPYRERIWKEITRGRLTIPAILEAVEEILPPGGGVHIKEPYKYIFKYNISELSEEHAIQDGIYYSHGVIDIVISGPMPDGVLDLVDELRAGGVIVYISSTGELHEGPLPMYFPDAKNRIGYEAFIELMCKYADAFVLDESVLGDTKLLSGSGVVRFKSDILFEFPIARWYRHPNSPTISSELVDNPVGDFVVNESELGDIKFISGYAPEYRIPEDKTFYFNATRTDIVFDIAMEDRQSYPVISDNYRHSDVKPVPITSYFKVGSILEINDLLDKSITELDPGIPKGILVEVESI